MYRSGDTVKIIASLDGDKSIIGKLARVIKVRESSLFLTRTADGGTRGTQILLISLLHNGENLEVMEQVVTKA